VTSKSHAVGSGTGSRRRPPGAATTLTRIEVDLRPAIAVVTLNRPEVHNAFDQRMIAELTGALRRLDRDSSVRAIVLAGAGKSFCAGADLNWMREMATYSPAQNLADANALARMLVALNRMSKPTIARVHGPAYGGGVGLVACCDIALGTPEATFALSEARLGLIPATIGPYVVDAIGARAARRYFVTGERFGAGEAHRLGLLHEVAAMPSLDARINDIIGALLITGPKAQAECKDLIRTLAGRRIEPSLIADTARRIARVRASPEAKEGVAAFLGKRKASWVPEGE
jgi:methylglutaconyl-CoA hydratase